MGILQDYTLDRSKLTDALTRFVPRGMAPAPPDMPEGAEGMFEKPAPQMATNGGSSSPGSPRPPDARNWSAKEKEAAVKVAAEDVRLSLNALAEKLKSLPGRKSVFWVTQGFSSIADPGCKSVRLGKDHC